MVQKQIAFEKTKLQQEALTLSDISPKWAKRLEEKTTTTASSFVNYMAKMVI